MDWLVSVAEFFAGWALQIIVYGFAALAFWGSIYLLDKAGRRRRT